MRSRTTKLFQYDVILDRGREIGEGGAEVSEILYE